ncbi:MAG: DUF4421 domain-containing protein [Flavobacteriales bacterium]|nr:DUF4421 domain-containing protein [Flavobacteriales bacterium]
MALYSLTLPAGFHILFPFSAVIFTNRFCIAVSCVCLMVPLAPAQDRANPQAFDTAYVADYSHLLSLRIYSSTKYNALTIASRSATDLVHRPNNRINIGIGASYRSLTLNIGFGIPFVNNDEAVRGKTQYLDAQANVHTQRWAANLFLQIFGGYYIASHNLEQVGWVQDTERPYRADLVQFNLGGSALRIANHRRFSYRAAFTQDAWQRKSQGSVLVGGYITYYNVRADSSLVPSALSAGFDRHARMRRGTFFDIGPMGGYACTFVLKEHWFLTASAAVGAGLSIQNIVSTDPGNDVVQTDAGPGWHAQMRASGGYNSRKINIALSFNQENIGYLLTGQESFRWNVGNVRLNLVKRFNRRVPMADRGIRWFRKKLAAPIDTAP